MKLFFKVVFMSKLYLKKINLTGYKNFSKSTTVELQENLNIVFGPHGCGKSNLFSAINWVLFDNKTAKEVIDSIVFHGNDVVQKTDFAEVSLFYGENSEPSDEDIIITRRLERNGNENFFLNKIQLSDFESYKEKISNLHLSEVCFLDDFDKDKKHRKALKIYSDIELRRQGKQAIVVLTRVKNIKKHTTGGLIGITGNESLPKVVCLNVFSEFQEGNKL